MNRSAILSLERRTKAPFFDRVRPLLGASQASQIPRTRVRVVVVPESTLTWYASGMLKRGGRCKNGD